MRHETHRLDHADRQPVADHRGGAAHAAVSRHDALAGHEAAARPPQDVVGHGAALAVGRRCQALTDGETIQLTQVTRDFIHWINPQTGSTGRMMRCYFLNFFTPISQ